MTYKTAILLLPGIFLVFAGCHNRKDDEDNTPLSSPKGPYNGTAVSSANVSRTLLISIETEDNPLLGTYTLGTGGGLAEEKGKISASVLGMVLDMTLKPDGTGTTYSLAGTLGEGNGSIKGTMKGTEAGKTVNYTVNVAK